MAVALLDHALAVRAGGAAALGQHHRVEPQPHRPPLVGDVPLLGQEVDHVVRGRWIELRGIGAVEAADVAGILDDRALHAETDAEVGHLVLARVSDRLDLALDAAIAEASGDEDPVETGNVAGQALALEPLRVDPGEFHRGLVGDAAVGQRLVEALVGVLDLDVLADHPDGRGGSPSILAMLSSRPCSEKARGTS